MAGIYIHIPFCKQACHYCNFHFSTSLRHRDDMIQAIVKEIDLQQDFLDQRGLTSIYFGGGTPSLLSYEEVSLIINQLSLYYTWADDIEVTIEANPDDIDPQKLKSLRSAGINRLSIGLQSFIDSELIACNRAHTADESLRAVKSCQDAGITNLSIDLIYGMPDSTMDSWQYNVDQALSLSVDHISSYALTVEPATALAGMVKKKSINLPSDTTVSKQYLILIDSLANNGYDHYEISNFAKPEKYAVHNTNYWRSKPYLGLGPSAHSYKSGLRQWNIANNAKYITSINNNTIPAEIEYINYKNKYNEWIMTRLRTMWGINRERISDLFPDELSSLDDNMKKYIDAGHVNLINNHYVLSNSGKLLADRISSDLFIVF